MRRRPLGKSVAVSHSFTLRRFILTPSRCVNTAYTTRFMSRCGRRLRNWTCRSPFIPETAPPPTRCWYYYLPRLRSAQTTVAFTIGNMLASTALIMGGVLERHPRLRVVHLESGAGWAAFWLDRLGAGVQGGFRGLDIEGLSRPPVEYFKRQCYISADPDDPGIRQVIDAIGDNNIVTATDFAHPEGRQYAWAVKEMMALPGVSDDSKRKIMWDNALRLYPIQPDA